MDERTQNLISECMPHLQIEQNLTIYKIQLLRLDRQDDGIEIRPLARLGRVIMA